MDKEIAPEHELKDDKKIVNESMVKLVMQFTNNIASILEYAEYLEPIVQKHDTQDFLNMIEASSRLSGFKEGVQLIQLVKAGLDPENVGKKISDLVDFDLEGLNIKMRAMQELTRENPNLFNTPKIDRPSQADKAENLKFLQEEALRTAGFEIKPPINRETTFSDLALTSNLTVSRVNKVNMLLQTSLITLISMFESITSDLLRIYYRAYNDALPSEVKQLSLSDLKTLASVEDAIEHIIDTEISGFLYRSVDTWPEFFKTRIKVDLGLIDMDWGIVVEIYQRRHTLVHNAGRVSRQYINKVPEEHRKDAKIGDKLLVDMSYLLKSADSLESWGFAIINALWSKLDRQDKLPRLVGFSYLMLHSLEHKRWHMLRSCITEFIKDKGIPEPHRTTIEINLWLSIKRIDGLEAIRQNLDSFDHSTTEKGSSAAVYALAEDLDNFILAYEQSDLTVTELKAWSIFDEFRQDVKFQDVLSKAE